LTNFLLYTKQEKEQFSKIKAEFQSSPHTIYGIEILLRLFVALPKLCAAYWFNEKEQHIFINACEKILLYFSLQIELKKNNK